MSGEQVRTQTITALLRGSGSEPEVMERLFPIVYEELRSMARRQVRNESLNATINATALVHEAYLRLVDRRWESAESRGYFFGAASRVMKQILVDHARRRLRQKRGGGERPRSLEDDDARVDGHAADLVGLSEALERLAAIEPRAAHVIECRYFGGLSVEETSAALGVSVRTVKRDWVLARAWLHRELRSTDAPGRNAGG